MKNILFLCLVFCVSCEKKIIFDVFPKAQIAANVDGIIRKGFAEAYEKNGMLVIDTWDGLFGIDLYVEKLSIGTYPLGMNQFNEATVYPDLSREILGSSNVIKSTEGKVVITDFNLKDSTISGVFEFDAQSSLGLTNVKNGTFEHIKVIKSDKTFFNKVSFKRDNDAVKLRENEAWIDNKKRLCIVGERFVNDEHMGLYLPLSTFKQGKQELFAAFSNKGAETLYYNRWLSTGLTKFNKGTYEWVKLDTINRIAEIRFEAEFEDTKGQKINITEGSMEVQYK